MARVSLFGLKMTSFPPKLRWSWTFRPCQKVYRDPTLCGQRPARVRRQGARERGGKGVAWEGPAGAGPWWAWPGKGQWGVGRCAGAGPHLRSRPRRSGPGSRPLRRSAVSGPRTGPARRETGRQNTRGTPPRRSGRHTRGSRRSARPQGCSQSPQLRRRTGPGNTWEALGRAETPSHAPVTCHITRRRKENRGAISVCGPYCSVSCACPSPGVR